MTDIFASEGIEPPKDIFAQEGIVAPSIQERNISATSPLLLKDAPEDVQAEVNDNFQQYESLAKARFSEEQITEMKAKGPIRFTEAKNFLDAQDVLPGGGIYQAFDTAMIYKTAKKKEAGEETTAAEDELLNKYIDRQIELNVRGLSVGGGIAYYGARMPAFMIEFAATGGVGKLAQEGAEQAAGKLVKNVVMKKATGVTANIAARSAVMPTMYVPKYAEARLNDYMAVTDKGAMIFKESEETPAMSALKAFGHTSVEVASELSGAAIGKYVVGPVVGQAAKYLKTPMAQAVNSLPTALRQNLYTAYKAINPNARVSKVFTAMGWNGMLEELGEERVADILHASLDMATEDKYTFQQYLDAITPSSDQLLIESGIIAIAGGVRTSANIGMNILSSQLGDSAAAKETIENLSQTEQEALVNSKLTLKPDVIPLPQSDLTGVAATQGKAAEFQDPPQINNEESGFNRFYRDFFNRLQPIEDITREAIEKGADIKKGENPFTLSRTYAGIIGVIEHNLRYGTTRLNPDTGTLEVTGKALKAIQDDFDNSISHVEASRDVRSQEFNDYLIARRTLADLSEREDVKVSEADKAKAAMTMRQLAEKYGQDMTWFDTFANETYEYQQRVLYNLVEAGNMSQETYDDILKKNPNYIPFQRVLDDAEKSFGVSSKGIFTNANKNRVIKRIEGSEREIKNTTQSIIANTARIMELAHRNRVAQAVADLAPIMPEYVQKQEATKVKRGTTKIKISYDAGLRRKLEQTIAAFGNSIDRVKNPKVKGLKNVRGSYSAMEKIVRVRIGTTEGTLAHEVGHMLDHSLDLKSAILNNKTAKSELQKLAEERLSGKETLTEKGKRIVFEDRVLEATPESYIEYIKNDDEILANMFDAYVNSPDKLKKVAPTAFKLFEGVLNSDPRFDFIKQIKPTQERAEEEIEQDVWGPLDTPPQGTITVFREGKKEYYKVSPAMLEAMENLSPTQMNATMRMLTSPFRASASLLRAGATLIPEFWIRNVIRDQSTAFLQSPIRPTPIDAVRGLTAVMGKSDLYKDWLRNGGSFNSYMELDDKGLEKAYKELLRPQGKLARYTRNPINILADISGALEQGTRVGVYGKAQRLGIKGMEAALMSREATLDFARGGVVSKRVNQYIPFFNAGVQSVDKLIRTFKENPKATMFWGVATITAPSVLLTGYYLYGAPEDERREYLEIPQWQKDLFWVFKDPTGQWRRIPKPFSFGYLFGSVPERFMLWAYQGNKPEMKDFWMELAMGVGGTLSPVYDPSALLPPLVKLTVEDLTNYNFFTGRNIYPTWMDRLEPEKRANKYTSETARELGELLGVSPAIIDNSLRGQLAGTADYITDATDSILNSVKEWNGETLPEKPMTQADMAVVKAFTVREPVGYGSNTVSNFFDAWEQVSQVHATLGQLDGEEKAQYMEENAQLLRAYKPMKNYYESIRNLGKSSDKVYEDKAMDSDAKVKALSNYGKQMVDEAVRANDWFKQNVK